MTTHRVPRGSTPILAVLIPTIALSQPFMLLAGLKGYDAAIAADHGDGAGYRPHAALLEEAVTFDKTDSAEFNFGEISGDATFEFILEGDPLDGGQDGYLAVGENATNNLRYEQWNDTGQLGFTRLGVADNLFIAEGDENLLLSPEVPTHVAYLWMEDGGRMELYVDGALAGSIDGVAFEMPFGQGLLGNNAGGTEGMLGTIHRVTTYGRALSADTILAHAEAWLAPDTDPSIHVASGVELVLTGAVQNFTFNVLNSGEAIPLNIIGVEFAGTDAGKFSVTTAVPFSVPPGGQAAISYSFDPMGATGAISANLVIESDDPQREEVTVQIAGLNQDPNLETAAALDFGEATGTVSRTLEVANKGATKDLVISGVTVSGPEAAAFSATNPGTIAPGASGQITVTFNPADATGSFDAVLEIASNDPAARVTPVALSALVPIDDSNFAAYDATIDADHGNGNGTHPYEAVLREPAVFDTTGSVAFDFGEISDGATFEFIVEGDPADGGRDGYLAVGENAGDNLRYEQWDDTGQLGFTRLGVADYLFAPENDPGLVLSPEVPTHVTYLWNADESRMELYINGILAGVNGDAPDFGLPTGMGLLGNNAGASEGMLGTIHRLVTYDDLLPPEVILRHALAFTEGATLAPFAIINFTANLPAMSASLTWTSLDGSTYIVESSLDLINWLELADGLPATGEETSFTDDTLTGDERQLYYRVTRD